MSEVGRIISYRQHQNEEARIVLLTIKWIVALPGTLLEVGNCQVVATGTFHLHQLYPVRKWIMILVIINNVPNMSLHMVPWKKIKKIYVGICSRIQQEGFMCQLIKGTRGVWPSCPLWGRSSSTLFQQPVMTWCSCTQTSLEVRAFQRPTLEFIEIEAASPTFSSFFSYPQEFISALLSILSQKM